MRYAVTWLSRKWGGACDVVQLLHINTSDRLYNLNMGEGTKCFVEMAAFDKIHV